MYDGNDYTTNLCISALTVLNGTLGTWNYQISLLTKCFLFMSYKCFAWERECRFILWRVKLATFPFCKQSDFKWKQEGNGIVFLLKTLIEDLILTFSAWGWVCVDVARDAEVWVEKREESKHGKWHWNIYTVSDVKLKAPRKFYFLFLLSTNTYLMNLVFFPNKFSILKELSPLILIEIYRENFCWLFYPVFQGNLYSCSVRKQWNKYLLVSTEAYVQ